MAGRDDLLQRKHIAGKECTNLRLAIGRARKGLAVGRGVALAVRIHPYRVPSQSLVPKAWARSSSANYYVVANVLMENKPLMKI